MSDTDHSVDEASASECMSDFEHYVREHLDELNQLINTYVPQKEEKSEDCLHIGLKNALGDFESVINGAEVSDFIPNPDYEVINKRAGFIFPLQQSGEENKSVKAFF